MKTSLWRFPFFLSGLLLLIYNTFVYSPPPELLLPAMSAVFQTGTDPGVTVDPDTLNLTEGGAAGSYTIVLNSIPEAPVTINIDSVNAAVNVSPGSVTFDPGVDPAAQTITVEAVDDQAASGPCTDTIQHTIVTTDTAYAGITAPDVTVNIAEDDTPGVTVTQSGGSTAVTEGSPGTDDYTVVLDSQPLGDVIITITPDSQVSASPSQLTFTSTTWDIPQTVTVQAVDDEIVETSPHTGVISHTASSVDDSLYDGISVSSVNVAVTDNDVPGIEINDISGSQTTEAGGQVTFTVRLAKAPAGSVTLNLISSDPGEGTVSPASMTFTPDDWDDPQQAAVTGIDDYIDDDNVAYDVQVAVDPATSHAAYHSASMQTVNLTNVDNDTAGVIVTPSGGSPRVFEGGSIYTYTVALTSRPVANVVINANPDSQVTASPSPLTITPETWNATRTVTVRAVDDALPETSPYSAIITHTITTTDTKYSSLPVSDIMVQVMDNDGAINLTVNGAAVTYEDQSKPPATLTVKLASKPSDNVDLMIKSLDTSEGEVMEIMPVTLTPDQALSGVEVTVKGADDDWVDGDISYEIEASIAATTQAEEYKNVSAAKVQLVNQDNDVPAITITPAVDLTTTEGGGTATFNVGLATRPAGSVTLNLISTDPTEGTIDRTSLTFDQANWGAIPVTVKGEDDTVADGNVEYEIRVSVNQAASHTGYHSALSKTIKVTNFDNEIASIDVNPKVGLFTSEDGDTAVITIMLSSQPISTVTLRLESSNPKEGIVQPNTIEIPAVDWSTPVTATIKGVDDLPPMVDGDQPYTISIAAIDGYQGAVAPVVNVINLDNDAAGLVLTADENLITSENGLEDTFQVRLRNPPSQPVKVTVDTSNHAEGIVTGPSVFVFDDDNWRDEQTVTIIGEDDDFADGDVFYQVELVTESVVEPYNAITETIPVVNLDNDTAGVAVIPVTTLVTTEGGGTAVFMLTLNTQPTDAVTLMLKSSDESEGIAYFNPDQMTATTGDPNEFPKQITIQPDGWDDFYKVIVTGINDSENDGHVEYQIQISVNSNDPAYRPDKFPNLNITVKNLDDDGPSIYWVSPVNTINGDSIIHTYSPAEYEITLEVMPDTSRGIQFVYFYRWDIRMNNGLGDHVPIATVTDEPYKTILHTNDLHQGSNQIFVAAVDGDGNQSEHKRIILVKGKQNIFLPFVSRSR